MPVSFAFYDASGNQVDLDTIDREMCEVFGMTPNETNFCPEFQYISTMGICICWRNSKATPELFDEYMRKNQKEFEISDENVPKIKHFLVGKYTFSAWR